MADTLGPILPPPRTGFYAEREADLLDALRVRVMASPADGDLLPVVLEAFRAGWGLVEIHRSIAMLRTAA